MRLFPRFSTCSAAVMVEARDKQNATRNNRRALELVKLESICRLPHFVRRAVESPDSQCATLRGRDRSPVNRLERDLLAV